MTFGTSDRTGRPTRRPRRPWARTLVPPAVAGWAALEIWLLTVVAGRIGGPAVLLILLAGFLLGGLAVKRAGRRAWNSLAAAVRPAPPRPGEPDTEPSAGVATAQGAGTEMLGGLLLMVPGLVSDAAAVLCLFPPTARLLRAAGRRVAGRAGRRGHPAGPFGGAFQQARMRMPDGKVVPGEVIREDRRGDGRHRDRGPDDGSPRPPLAP